MRAIKYNNIQKVNGGFIIATLNDEGAINIFIEQEDIVSFHSNYIIVSKNLSKHLQDIQGINLPENINPQKIKHFIEILSFIPEIYKG